MRGSIRRDSSLGVGDTRRGVLRKMLSTGVLATAGAGVGELLSVPAARASTPEMRLPATMVLNALPEDAPSSLIAAIEAGCCIHYTRDEGHCGSGCPSGECCYHVVSTGCGLNEIVCIDVSCAEGNFTTGC